MSLPALKPTSQMRTAEDRAFCEIALRAASQAFAPVSGFAVGACIVADDGREFVGQNQENLAFNAIHAETSALKSWNEGGAPKFKALAIAGLKFWPKSDLKTLVTPCGECRQWIFEAALRSNSTPRILCANGDLSRIEVYSINELLPSAFEIGSSNPFPNWHSMQASLRKLIGG